MRKINKRVIYLNSLIYAHYFLFLSFAMIYSYETRYMVLPQWFFASLISIGFYVLLGSHWLVANIPGETKPSRAFFVLMVLNFLQKKWYGDNIFSVLELVVYAGYLVWSLQFLNESKRGLKTENEKEN